MTSKLLRGAFTASILLALSSPFAAPATANEKANQKNSETSLSMWERIVKKNEERMKKFHEMREARMQEFQQRREGNKAKQSKSAKPGSKKVVTKTKTTTKKTTTKKSVKAKGAYGGLISKYAAQHGVPYNLARAVVQVESSFRPNVTGAAGEVGLMQIKLATARGMGYKGSRKALYNPATNLYWGMKYLGRAHQLSGGTICGTILKYNAGHYAKRNNPISSRYCQKVKRII